MMTVIWLSVIISSDNDDYNISTVVGKVIIIKKIKHCAFINDDPPYVFLNNL